MYTFYGLAYALQISTALIVSEYDPYRLVPPSENEDWASLSLKLGKYWKFDLHFVKGNPSSLAFILALTTFALVTICLYRVSLQNKYQPPFFACAMAGAIVNSTMQYFLRPDVVFELCLRRTLAWHIVAISIFSTGFHAWLKSCERNKKQADSNDEAEVSNKGQIACGEALGKDEKAEVLAYQQ